jgi:hypothetical protein
MIYILNKPQDAFPDLPAQSHSGFVYCWIRIAIAVYGEIAAGIKTGHKSCHSRYYSEFVGLGSFSQHFTNLYSMPCNFRVGMDNRAPVPESKMVNSSTGIEIRADSRPPKYICNSSLTRQSHCRGKAVRIKRIERSSTDQGCWPCRCWMIWLIGGIALYVQ